MAKRVDKPKPTTNKKTPAEAAAEDKWWQDDAARYNAMGEAARRLGVTVDLPGADGKKADSPSPTIRNAVVDAFGGDDEAQGSGSNE